MRYLFIFLIILINGCSTSTVRYSKNVNVDSSISKSNHIKIIKENEQVPFSYHEIGAIYVEELPPKFSAYNESFMLPLLVDAAKEVGADAVVGVHTNRFLPTYVDQGGGGSINMKDYMSGVLVKFTDKNTDKNAINDNFIDILPLGNPEKVHSENGFIKDKELVRIVAQQFVERNGYYARLIEDNFTLESVNDIEEAQVSGLGNANAKYILYMWPSYVAWEENDYGRETMHAAVLKSVLINKKTGEIVWQSKPVPEASYPSLSVKDNDMDYIYETILTRGVQKLRVIRAKSLYWKVKYYFANFKPNYKEHNIKPKDVDLN